MSVTTLKEFQSRDTIATLEKLLEQAKQGEVLGLMFCIRTGIKQHAMGLTGEYFDDPVMAVAVASRMKHRLNILADERESAKDKAFSNTSR